MKVATITVFYALFLPLFAAFLPLLLLMALGRSTDLTNVIDFLRMMYLSGIFPAIACGLYVGIAYNKGVPARSMRHLLFGIAAGFIGGFFFLSSISKCPDSCVFSIEEAPKAFIVGTIYSLIALAFYHLIAKRVFKQPNDLPKQP